MLRITVSQVVHVKVVGNLDVATAPEAEKILTELSGDVLVDGTGITFIDSAGFRTFDIAHEAARTRGSSFQVFGLHPYARRVAEILGLPYLVPAAA